MFFLFLCYFLNSYDSYDIGIYMYIYLFLGYIKRNLIYNLFVFLG